MRKFWTLLFCFIVCILFICNNNLLCREVVDKSKIQQNKSASFSSSTPQFCLTKHDIGNLTLAVRNIGRMGMTFYDRFTNNTDCFTGRVIALGSEFPKGSRLEKLYMMAIWVGAVVGDDTLVSVSSDGWADHPGEFIPNSSPYGQLTKRSIDDPGSERYDDMISEQDISCVYTDTGKIFIRDDIDLRYHKPLNIEITQNSYAWSYDYAEDFVLFDFSIKNIGKKTLDQLYFGILFIGDFGYLGLTPVSPIAGFLNDYPSPQGCNFNDTVKIAWTASRDGIPVDGEYNNQAVWLGAAPYKADKNITGISFLRDQKKNSNNSFNWWIRTYVNDEFYFYGPQQKEKLRFFGDGGLGFPIGDRNKYYVMSNNEFDYDQAFTSKIRSFDPIWHYTTNRNAMEIISSGIYGLPFILRSSGPYTLTPGASFPFSFSFVCGENFHTDPNNIDNLPHNPNDYMKNVDFSDLVKNTKWASWIYDNPGIDTDGDGFYGKYRICAIDSIETESGWTMTKADTTFYEGDGIPDWRAAGPPPAPDFWLEPQNNSIRIRFNGERSETEKDFMTGIVDFEGYHLWMGRDERATSLSIIASYDLYNFDKYVFNKNLLPDPNFLLHDNPMTLEQLRCRYGKSCDDSLFNPLDYVRHDPYIHPDYPDSIFIFLPHNNNTSELGVTTPITKVYPNAVNPNSIHPDSLTDIHYTEDGYFKYYEYQFYVKNLLPTVPYYFNVTSFDMGSAQTGLNPIESSKTVGVQYTYPLSPGTSLTDDNRKVYIYPNPYIIDAGYRDKRYEGRNKDYLPPDKVRAIHFNNLPAKCEISIFSFDGDLVRRMTHDFDEDDPNKLQHEWNLVTKNRQLVVSGIYYWTVEDHNGKVQMGKLVIIM